MNNNNNTTPLLMGNRMATTPARKHSSIVFKKDDMMKEIARREAKDAKIELKRQVKADAKLAMDAKKLAKKEFTKSVKKATLISMVQYRSSIDGEYKDACIIDDDVISINKDGELMYDDVMTFLEFDSLYDWFATND